MARANPFPTMDDQSLALQLQLEEIDDQRQRQHGKWKEDNPPNFVFTFD